MNVLWPGYVEIFAKMGVQWYPIADKHHSSCQPRETGDNVLLPSQQLLMNLIHYNLIMILTHISNPKLPASKVRPFLAEQELYILSTISLREEQENFTPISNISMCDYSHSSFT